MTEGECNTQQQKHITNTIAEMKPCYIFLKKKKSIKKPPPPTKTNKKHPLLSLSLTHTTWVWYKGNHDIIQCGVWTIELNSQTQEKEFRISPFSCIIITNCSDSAAHGDLCGNNFFSFRGNKILRAKNAISLKFLTTLFLSS